MKTPKSLTGITLFVVLAFALPSSAEDLVPKPAPAADLIRIETKVIEGPAGVFRHGEIVDPGTHKKRLAEIGSKKGWDVLSAPTVITRDGQKATVEVGRELVFAPDKEVVWAGIKIDLDLRSGPGGAIRTKAHAVLSEASGEKEDSAPLLTFEQKFDGAIPAGHTVALVVPTKEPGRLATFLVTPNIIGPDGKEK